MDNLFINSELYEGKFVILDNFENKNIIFSSDDTNKLLDEINNKKIESPYIVYVPESNSINILWVYLKLILLK